MEDTGWAVTFRLSGKYEYYDHLLSQLSEILHAEYFSIGVKQSALELKYVIREDGARKLAEEQAKEENANND